jgi:hypothetical protein
LQQAEKKTTINKNLDFSAAIAMIIDLKYEVPDSETIFNELIERKMRGLVFRTSTPIEKILVKDVPSPSRNEEDQMILEHMSVKDEYNFH